MMTRPSPADELIDAAWQALVALQTAVDRNAEASEHQGERAAKLGDALTESFPPESQP